jgi:hypothetical protein
MPDHDEHSPPRRSERLEVRVSPEEKKRLRILAAHETGGDVSALVRRRTLGVEPDAT